MNIASSHSSRALRIEHSAPCLVATVIVFITVSGSMDISTGGTKVELVLVFRAELAKFPYLR